MELQRNKHAQHKHQSDADAAMCGQVSKDLTRTSGDVYLQVAFALLLRWYADKCSSGHVDGKDRTKK